MLYHTMQPRNLDHSFAQRQHVLVTLKACLYAFRDEVRIVKNICLTLRRFYADLELAPFASELCEQLLNVALAHASPTVRWSAIAICSSELASLSPSIKRECVKRNAIEKVRRALPACQLTLAAWYVRDHLTSVGQVLRLLHELPVPAEPTPQEDRDVLYNRLAFEGCWAFLWNVTDESDSHCARVVDNDGLLAIAGTLKVCLALWARCDRQAFSQLGFK